MKLNILSWNIWQGAYLDEVKRFLKDTDADIVALQEVSQDNRNIIKDIASTLGYSFVTAFDMDLPMKYMPEHLRTDTDSIKYGNAILTKYPIVKGGSIPLSDEDARTIAQADIQIGEEVLHVYGLHLKHTHQKPSDLQSRQADTLLKMLPEKRAVALGDFNALPESYAIQKVSEVLKNTETGGPTPTWSVYKNGCSVCQEEHVVHKLDYIFVTQDIAVESFRVGQTKGSDHLPVMATVVID